MYTPKDNFFYIDAVPQILAALIFTFASTEFP